jgi:hypothetical protein
MKEIKILNGDLTELYNSMILIAQNQFPGISKLYYNLGQLTPAMDNLNKDIRSLLKKHIKGDVVEAHAYEKNNLSEVIGLPIDEYNDRIHIISKDDPDWDKIEPGLTTIMKKEVIVKIQELDVLTPVFLVNGNISIRLRDYLEQIVRPVTLLFPLEAAGVIKNLYSDGEQTDSR